jgi:murein DD-endopeptidase MepM/ murein hydrolase activator NlpD
MNPRQDLSSQENSSKNLIVLAVILIIILGTVFTLIFIFKPETKDFNSVKGEIKNSPKEHIKAIESSILKIYYLTDEIRLIDELYDELVYADSPDVDQIGEFARKYKNYAALYSEDKNNFSTSDLITKDYDSTILIFKRQQEYLEKSIASLLKSIDYRHKMFISIPVAYPLAKKDAKIISGFGMRDHPILNEPRMHTGIDIKAPVGTAVIATASGKVINTQEQIGFGYGRPCVIEHKFGYQTLYGHMVRLEVFKNKIVQKGDIIGRVGDTGLSQGPHLHYEVRKNGRPLNPSLFMFEGLTEAEYKEVVALGTQ